MFAWQSTHNSIALLISIAAAAAAAAAGGRVLNCVDSTEFSLLRLLRPTQLVPFDERSCESIELCTHREQQKLPQLVSCICKI